MKAPQTEADRARLAARIKREQAKKASARQAEILRTNARKGKSTPLTHNPFASLKG